MKKIQKLALSFMMGGLALCFASCGSDDDTTFDLPNVGQATTTINDTEPDRRSLRGFQERTP